MDNIERTRNFFKLFLCMIGLLLYVMGVIGGVGYALYLNKYVIAFSVIVTGAFGIPTVKRLWKILNE